MSVKLTVSELQQQLPHLLDRAVESGEECFVKWNGKDYAVLVSAREWKRRTMGRRLEMLGPAYRLPKNKQQRAEHLLAKRKQSQITSGERRELNTLLRECDAVMLRRAGAMDRHS